MQIHACRSHVLISSFSLKLAVGEKREYAVYVIFLEDHYKTRESGKKMIKHTYMQTARMRFCNGVVTRRLWLNHRLAFQSEVVDIRRALPALLPVCEKFQKFYEIRDAGPEAATTRPHNLSLKTNAKGCRCMIRIRSRMQR